jgi:ribosomal protein S18 acetylase RimI-like enzyme
MYAFFCWEEIMSLQIRSFKAKDLSTLVRLLNEARQGSYEFMPLTEEEVGARIQEGKSSALIAEKDGEIVGSATYNDGYWGEEIRWLGVRGGPDQKLIEDALVKKAEELVRKGTVFISVDAGSPKTNEWIDRGYAPSSGLYQMIAKLDSSRILPTLPEGFRIGSMKLGEEPEVVATVNAVFGWDRLKSDFVEKGKVDSSPFDEEWVHVAYHGNKVVSVVVAWPAVKFNAYFGAKRGYLGPAATLSDFRAKKLASALTVRAMNFLFEKGFDQVVLHTSELNVPSVTLLRNLGFEVMHHIRFLKKSVPPTGQIDPNLIDERPEN